MWKKLLNQILPLVVLGLIVGPHMGDVLQTEEAPTEVAEPPSVPEAPPEPPATPEEWFASLRPRCTSGGVQLAVDLDPPPEGLSGVGYEAACFAVADHIPKARALILGLPEDDRVQAASVVFNVAQGMVEQGRETEAAPLMELVLEFWPNHYVALYEAGITRFAEGDYTHARIYLGRFLEVYVRRDERADRARRMIQEMDERDDP